MNSLFYRNQWNQMRQNGIDITHLHQLCKKISFSFIDHSYYNGHYEEEYINLLCEIATYSQDTQLTSPASSGLFGIIIEQLCDDYQDFQFEIYNRVMTQVISYCRALPDGATLHAYLNANHITNHRELFQYAQRVHYKQYRIDPTQPVRLIFLLSRITIGADVAIVSVIVQRLMKQFPQAEIVIIGNEKLKEIFGGNPRLRVLVLQYHRHGGLLQRLGTWIDAVEMIKEASATESPDRVLIIDPDSRITQLGMLPLGGSGHHLYFDSHPKSSINPKASIAEITNQWVSQVFGPSDFCFPHVWLTKAVRHQVEKFERTIRNNGCKRIVVVNIGVGGNNQKQLGVEFEKKLVLSLLADQRTVVVFDMGLGAEEYDRLQSILAELRNHNINVQQCQFDNMDQISLRYGILAVQNTIGQTAGLISCADEFIGYDSACQHIAAALGTPTLTIFAGTNNPSFIHRWSACGESPTKIIHVNNFLPTNSSMIETTVERIMEERTPTMQNTPSFFGQSLKATS